MSALDDLARDVREEVSKELHDELAADGVLTQQEDKPTGVRAVMSSAMGKLAMCVGVPLILIAIVDAIAIHHLNLVAAAPDSVW